MKYQISIELDCDNNEKLTSFISGLTLLGGTLIKVESKLQTNLINNVETVLFTESNRDNRDIVFYDERVEIIIGFDDTYILRTFDIGEDMPKNRKRFLCWQELNDYLRDKYKGVSNCNMAYQTVLFN